MIITVNYIVLFGGKHFNKTADGAAVVKCVKLMKEFLSQVDSERHIFILYIS